jgi:Xaa-Pro aminopeptidase
MDAPLDARRRRAAAAWDLKDEVVLVGAGEPVPIPGGADQVYPFLSHAEYFWLADRETAGGVLAFDPQDGWTDFVPPVTEAERVWEGRTDAPGAPIGELAGWLAARRGRAVVPLGTPLAGLAGDHARVAALREALTHARRPKDEAEIARLRRAAQATAAGFEAARRAIRPGATEREIAIEMEAEFSRRGGDRTGYDSIVATGPHSAVLHFPPGARAVAAGDAVLIDAGAEIRRYTSDVTRTYRAAGGDEGFFRELYAVVLGVEERAIARCVPGAEWRDIHLAACEEIAAGLVELGLLRGRPADLVERETVALFFPHGIGHMVGLGVRDAGGYLPGRPRSSRPVLRNLRTDLPLEPGYMMTIEPGIYVIPPLVDHPERRARHRDALRDFGGIRIEDNVLVTEAGPEVLTAAVAKEAAEVLL